MKEIRKILHEIGLTYKIENREGRKECLDEAETAIKALIKAKAEGLKFTVYEGGSEIYNGALTDLLKELEIE